MKRKQKPCKSCEGLRKMLDIKHKREERARADLGEALARARLAEAQLELVRTAVKTLGAALGMSQ
jgi:hypothetical protein